MEEKQNRGQGGMRQVVGGSRINGTASRRQRPAERVWPQVEAVRVFFTVQPGKHGPAVTTHGWLLHSAFQGCPRHRVLRRREALVMTKAAEQSFIGSKRFGIAVA